MELFRSLLFVPGNRSDMLEKASTADTDILVPDMEDSVPDNEKSNARSLISEKLETLSGKNQSIVPRVNALDTGLTFDDIHAVVNSKTYGISVGKIESSWDIKEVSKIYNNLDKNVMKVFNVQNSVNSKNSYGGTSIKNIKKMISKLKKELK